MASPDKMVPHLADLVKHGMADLLIRAADYDPPIGARGIQASYKPISWAVTITPIDAARPMVRAIRTDPAEALEAASERFLAIFRDKKKLDPFEHAQPEAKKPAVAKAAKKPAPAPVDDDDGMDLI